jgi:hypothetical protein
LAFENPGSKYQASVKCIPFPMSVPGGADGPERKMVHPFLDMDFRNRGNLAPEITHKPQNSENSFTT